MKLLPRLALAASLSAATPLALQAQHTQKFTNEERYYFDGLELFDRGQYGAAQQSFQQYLDATVRRTGELRDRTADAEYYLAVSGLYLFHPDSEGRILAFAENNPAHPKAASAYFELGKFYFDKKDYKAADSYLARVAPTGLTADQRAEAEFKQAYSLFQLKEYDKAKLIFDRNKQGQHQYRYSSSYYAGYLAYRQGDYKAARADLATAEQNDAYRPVVPAIMSQIYYKEGNYDGLIDYGTKALAQNPPPQGADEIQLLVGDAFYQKEDWAKAAQYFDKYAAGRKKMDPMVSYKIGYANFKQGDFKGAIGPFKGIAAGRDSLGQNAAYHLGLSYLQTGSKQLALNSFDAARKATFDKQVAENAALKYAQVSYELGNTPDAITALEEFGKKYPRSKNRAAADDLLSEAYLSTTDYARALRYLDNLDERTTKLNATYQRITYLQAASLYNNGQYQQALPLLDKSLKYPQDEAIRAGAEVLRGEVYSIGQEYPKAISSYTAALRTAGRGSAADTDYDQKARYGLGYAYYNTKKYDQARPYFQQYLADPVAKPASDPNYYDVTLRLADTYYINKNYAQALELYDKVIQANAADKDFAYYQKSVTLGLMGRRDEAAKTLQTLLRVSPNSRYADDAVYQQANLDYESGNYQPAIQGFTRLIENRPNSPLLPSALVKRGTSYQNLQQHDKAAADFQQVLRQFPRTKAATNAISALQETLAAAGKAEEFDQYLAEYKATNPNDKAVESVEFEAAKSLYLAEKYQQAVPRLESYLKEHSGSALAPDARFFLADSYLKTNRKQDALPRLRAVAEENKSEYVNRAVARVAELEFENQNYPEAAKYYDRLRQTTRVARERASAGLGLARSLYEGGQFADAKRVAGEVVTEGSATPVIISQARLYVGKADYKAGNLDAAIPALTESARTVDVNGAEAQYLLADALYQQKKYEPALDAAFKLNSDFNQFDLWLGRAFLLISDIYRDQGEAFQAKATLNSIIDNKFPVQEIVDEAKRKLAALDSAPAAPTKGKTTTTKPGATKAPAKTPATGKAGARQSLVPPADTTNSDTAAPEQDAPSTEEE
ncbi:tetratricopeptide repeat protein [Hymenobacter gummosus]|uniref:Tetratricopeptide repeat protein n=1 Tax=Hymenobacter gummosus TaxID=1776032 RepID=A0A431TW58_9BACT|nr:tetratricopeptide repeat protein [Hymenobacter gummosus]RTQ45721.1 tetratricopeptide repeat protein [Hymenobacter gummosus]